MNLRWSFMKKLVLPFVLLLSACATEPVVSTLSNEDLEAMTCRQIMKEVERLELQVNRIQHGDKLFIGVEEANHEQALQAAKSRLQQVREESARKMCTFG